MKSCILITSHLNSPHKVNVALRNIRFHKSKSLPIILVGNYPLPLEVQKEVDYSLFINNNPKVNRGLTSWRGFGLDTLGVEIVGIRSDEDYGYAHLHQSLRGFKLCKELGYDYVYHFNYDAYINDYEYNKMLNITPEYTPMIFPWGENGIATACYGFKTSDYIEALEPKMHYYANNNPPLPGDWYCESFFKWVINKAGLDVEFSDVKIKLEAGNSDVVTPLGTINIFFQASTNSYLIFGISTTNPLEFQVNGEPIKTQPIEDNRFELPNIEGDYYLLVDGKPHHIFNSTPQFRNNNYIHEV